MDLPIILKSMRRNKVGAILIAVQMAVTLAILCNGLFIIQQRVAASRRPSGTDEATVFAFRNQWVGGTNDAMARLQTDLATLRALPGVIDAYATNSYPMNNGGDGEGIGLDPDDPDTTHLCAMYLADDHTLATLGLKLVAGRNFTPDEIQDQVTFNAAVRPKALIVTRSLADKLFQGQNPLGKTVYLSFEHNAIPIVGVVDRLQVPWSNLEGWGSKFFYDSILAPFRYAVPYSVYIVHTKPGQLEAVMRNSQKALIDLNRSRVLDKVQTFTQARAESYKDDRALADILGVVSAALVLVTGFGIVGLTSYWVAQRRRQIGIRRALGATRQAIVRYFQTENLLIAAVGTLLGIALAIGANLWMVSAFEMKRLDAVYAFLGAAAILALGQLAVLWPALRAASVPPALATRGA
jgi:putative ABC transport system permease protein